MLFFVMDFERSGGRGGGRFRNRKRAIAHVPFVERFGKAEGSSCKIANSSRDAMHVGSNILESTPPPPPPPHTHILGSLWS